MKRIIAYCARAGVAGFLIAIAAGVYLVLGRELAGWRSGAVSQSKGTI